MSALDELLKRVNGGPALKAVDLLAQVSTLLASDTQPADLLIVHTTSSEHAQILRAAYYWLQCCEAMGAPESLIAKLDATIDAAVPLAGEYAKSAVTRIG